MDSEAEALLRAWREYYQDAEYAARDITVQVIRDLQAKAAEARQAALREARDAVFNLTMQNMDSRTWGESVAAIDRLMEDPTDEQ